MLELLRVAHLGEQAAIVWRVSVEGAAGNYRGVCGMSAARLKLVECRKILGGERDPFRGVWDEQATAKDRRLLLAIGGETPQMAAHLAGRAWCDLSAHTRGEVQRGLRRFAEWAGKLS